MNNIARYALFGFLGLLLLGALTGGVSGLLPRWKNAMSSAVMQGGDQEARPVLTSGPTAPEQRPLDRSSRPAAPPAAKGPVAPPTAVQKTETRPEVTPAEVPSRALSAPSHGKRESDRQASGNDLPPVPGQADTELSPTHSVPAQAAWLAQQCHQELVAVHGWPEGDARRCAKTVEEAFIQRATDPLSSQQLHALAEGFSTYWSYYETMDPADSQGHTQIYNTLPWQIQEYFQRQPLSAEEERRIEQSFSALTEALQRTILSKFPLLPQEAVGKRIAEFRQALRSGLYHPLVPALKRPLTEAEVLRIVDQAFSMPGQSEFLELTYQNYLMYRQRAENLAKVLKKERVQREIEEKMRDTQADSLIKAVLDHSAHDVLTVTMPPSRPRQGSLRFGKRWGMGWKTTVYRPEEGKPPPK